MEVFAQISFLLFSDEIRYPTVRKSKSRQRSWEECGNRLDLVKSQNCRFCGSPNFGIPEKMHEPLKCWKDLCSNCHSSLGASLCRLLLPAPRKRLLLERYWSNDSYNLIIPSWFGERDQLHAVCKFLENHEVRILAWFELKVSSRPTQLS